MASTVGFSGHDHPPVGLCAIHQPNFLPRPTTLAKLFAADCWIVLDDVQFARRDYQHRARLAAMDDPMRRRWLSLPTHLPGGRSTTIREAVLVDPVRSRDRTLRTLRQYYGASPHWSVLQENLAPVLDLFSATDRTAAVAELSTVALLRSVGWSGHVVHSSDLSARRDRSQRLADLAAAVSARTYLCGTGGMTYLDERPFRALGIGVTACRTPEDGIWSFSREVTALWTLMNGGWDTLARQLRLVRGGLS
ncbi:WbqC family protein [Streptomyces luteireticuli]